MKYLTLITLLLIATSAYADLWDNCTAHGGTIITANSYGDDKSGGLCNAPSDPNLTKNCNGKRFCRGANKVNWWSAFTWCESIGGQLTSFEHICPGVQTIANNVTGACPNAKGISSDWCWTSTGWKTNYALNVNLASGAVYDWGSSGRSRLSTYFALCEEK